MKLKSLFFYLTAVLICACSKDKDKVIPKDEESYQESVIAYFKEIALGFEFGNASKVTRKWKVDMEIFVGGSKDPVLLTELEGIISEINQMASDGFTIRLTKDSLNSNFYVFLGSGAGYASIFPNQSGNIATNSGLFNVFFNTDNEFYKGHMYVDIVRTNKTEQKHLLREELTQSLGLGRDSKRFPDSIFQQEWTSTISYSEIDKDLIKALYHPKMLTGLDSNRVEPVLKSILSQIL